MFALSSAHQSSKTISVGLSKAGVTVNKLLAFTLISAVILLGAAGSANAQDDGGGIEIRQIKIIGLRFLDESAALSALTIKRGDVLVGNVTAKLAAAADALKKSGWFTGEPQLTLDSLDGPQGADTAAVLNVRIEENPRYNSIAFVGNSVYSSERLTQLVEAEGSDRLVRGEVINSARLVRAMRGVLKLYEDAGYIGAQIMGFDFNSSGDVVARLMEGMIDEVIIVGLEDTRESIAYSRISNLRPDTLLTRTALERDMNALYNTGLFETVVPSIEPSLRDGYARVVLNVEEAKTGQVGFGLGYSTVNGIQGSISYNEKNLFGHGKQLAASVTISDRKPSFDVTFTDRYFTDDSFYSVGLYSVHTKQQRYPGTAYESELNVDTKGLSLGYGKKLNEFDTWQVGIGVADYDYEILRGDPFRGYTPRQRARLSASGQTRKLTSSYTHDTRDNIFSTTEGVFGQLLGEFAGFGGDFSFNKWTAEGREFWRQGPGVVALRQRVGLSTGNVPIYEEYRYGGVNSVRGVEEDKVFGTHSFLSNAEYRYKINSMFSAAAFVDSAWAGESFGEMDNATSMGLGARIKLNFLGNQSVRLDYGWGVAGRDVDSKGRFGFYFGEMF
jgi:outer membrane protein insertion porin family